MVECECFRSGCESMGSGGVRVFCERWGKNVWGVLGCGCLRSGGMQVFGEWWGVSVLGVVGCGCLRSGGICECLGSGGV